MRCQLWECTELLPVIHALLQDAERYRQIASEILGVSRGTIVIGTAYYVYYGWLTEILSGFKKKYPQINVEMIEGTSTELIQAVEERRADLCIVSKRPGNYRWIPLKEDPLLAVLPVNHPLASQDRFDVRDFEKVDFIELYPNQETDNAHMFRQNHITPNTKFTTVDNYAAYEMVKAGFGVASTNKLIADSFSSGVVVLPLEPTFNVEIGIAATEDASASPAVRHLMDYVTARTKAG